LNRIKSIEHWQTLLQNSTEQPFLLFKLSLTCLSSIAAKKEMKYLATDLPIYVVIVQFDKKISNAIETDLGVKHETPQLLILKDGKATWQATHYHIKRPLVTEAIELYS
jgi:bacillithiol system protein YtxJ